MPIRRVVLANSRCGLFLHPFRAAVRSLHLVEACAWFVFRTIPKMKSSDDFYWRKFTASPVLYMHFACYVYAITELMSPVLVVFRRGGPDAGLVSFTL
jgi:hypothetical protein